MAYASQSGRAKTSARNPRAFGVCMRCGEWWNRDQLNFQYQWRGAELQNTFILVCRHCMDIPTEQNRAIVLPPDPVPIFYPSIEDFAADETDYRAISLPPVIDAKTGIPIPSTTLRITEDCQNRTLEPIGRPSGEAQAAQMPFNGATITPYGVPLSILSVTSDGSATVTVTCSKVHNLQPNSQISVDGLSFKYANGFYSVKILTATAFTYMTYGANPAESLLTPTTRIVTANIGLPLGYQVIPKLYGPPLITPTVAVCFLATEDGGIFELENGGYIQLEVCAQSDTYLIELESGTGTLLLESGAGSFELEEGP